MFFVVGVDRQLYAIPAGHGKSRVMGGIMRALAAKTTRGKPKCRSFHLVYNHRALLENDRDKMQSIADSCGVKVRFSVASGPIEVQDAEEVTIVDEADYVFLDKACKVVKLYKGKAPQIVGLTATAEKQLLGSEKTFLTGFLKFRIYDCKLESSDGGAEPEGVTLDTFLRDKKLDA